MAPDFDLETDEGERIRLSDFAGRKVVVYFYPKDDTSGCTLQAIDFTRAEQAFTKAGTVVIGISPDTVISHGKFRQKHQLGITLAADPEKKAIEAYGVWVEKSMYGRKYMGVERSTFLIGPDRRIAREWRKVKVPGHVEEVLEAAKAL
jgi:peroxiredoxin Q/BCP